jgi:flagellar motor component MotA
MDKKQIIGAVVTVACVIAGLWLWTKYLNK